MNPGAHPPTPPPAAARLSPRGLAGRITGYASPNIPPKCSLEDF
jgi:hypothetical protein